MYLEVLDNRFAVVDVIVPSGLEKRRRRRQRRVVVDSLSDLVQRFRRTSHKRRRPKRLHIKALLSKGIIQILARLVYLVAGGVSVRHVINGIVSMIVDAAMNRSVKIIGRLNSVVESFGAGKHELGRSEGLLHTSDAQCRILRVLIKI